MATEQAAPAVRATRSRAPLSSVATPLRATLVLAVLCLVSILVRVWLGRKIVTPWIMVDELIYSELAKSFSSSGHLLVRGGPNNLKSVVYPVVISPAWFAGSIATTYTIAKAINAVLMTLVALPVYFWTSRLTSRPWALVATALTLMMPSLIYTGTLMTETAFFPAFVFASFAIATALERPTILRQVFALAAIALACAVRVQGLILLLVLPTAVILGLLFELRAGAIGRRGLGRALLRFWPTGAALAVGIGGYVIYKLAQGVALSSALGSYREVATKHYHAREVARWLLYHFAELPFSVAMLPASALLLLLGLALRRQGTTGTAERAFLAVAASAVFWIVIEVAAFASQFSIRVEERYMFCLAPLLLVALVDWLARGLPRPVLPTAVAALTPFVLLWFLPLGRLLNVSIISDTFGLIPLLRLSNGVSGNMSLVRDLLLAGGAAAAVVFALAPKRLALPGFPLAVALFFFAASWTVHGTVRDYAKNLHAAGGLSIDPSWVDRALPNGAKAAFLYGTDVDPFQQQSVEWQFDFWNRDIVASYDLGAQESALAGSLLASDPKTGRLLVSGTSMAVRSLPYLVAESNVAIAGRKLAEHLPYALYRIAPPLRLASSTVGIYGDGWMGSDSAYIRYLAPRRSRVAVTLSRTAWRGPDVPGKVLIELVPLSTSKPIAVRRWVIHRTRSRTFTLSGPPQPYEVQVHISPTFSPAQFRQPDTRQLGAQVSFSYLPEGR